MNRRHFLLTTAASAFAVTLTACGKKLIVGRKVPAGASVLALGDSITFGIGATPEASYPAVLARLTGWNVINASISGDTSGEALARLPALLQQHSPQLVLMSIGGNDFLRHQPESEARSNVRRICEMAASAGAQALLIAIPAFRETLNKAAFPQETSTRFF